MKKLAAIALAILMVGACTDTENGNPLCFRWDKACLEAQKERDLRLCKESMTTAAGVDACILDRRRDRRERAADIADSFKVERPRTTDCTAYGNNISCTHW